MTDADAPDIACSTVHSPAPGAIAEVRAGGDVTFHWSHWLYSHKGPITAWMAPYDGDVADVDVNELEFIKFAEDTVDEEGVWANVRMMDDTNGTWTATIPADIKPGNYIIRQEVWTPWVSQGMCGLYGCGLTMLSITDHRPALCRRRHRKLYNVRYGPSVLSYVLQL